MRAAHRIDEREELDATSFLEWYDRTLPNVHDIKILAGAMEIELAQRRGERILQEGECRGGDSKGSQREPLPSNAVRIQRQKDRVLAVQPQTVSAYVQREAKAGRVPSVRGAVRVAWAARATAAPDRLAKQVEATQARKSEFDEQVFTAITTVADGRRPAAPAP